MVVSTGACPLIRLDLSRFNNGKKSFETHRARSLPLKLSTPTVLKDINDAFDRQYPNPYSVNKMHSLDPEDLEYEGDIEQYLDHIQDHYIREWFFVQSNLLPGEAMTPDILQKELSIESQILQHYKYNEEMEHESIEWIVKKHGSLRKAWDFNVQHKIKFLISQGLTNEATRLTEMLSDLTSPLLIEQMLADLFWKEGF